MPAQKFLRGLAKVSEEAKKSKLESEKTLPEEVRN
ncbi:MAG: hypothetical protein ACD_46C00099G0002 [uncultured bacterium]|nr:MAG: hypothetical protein ACD_46C00099G0002 [uncultured bacterium]